MTSGYSLGDLGVVETQSTVEVLFRSQLVDETLWLSAVKITLTLQLAG
jgi:hypothetical protein